MNFYYFIGLILLLIIIYLLRYNTVEKFDIKYHNTRIQNKNQGREAAIKQPQRIPLPTLEPWS